MTTFMSCSMSRIVSFSSSRSWRMNSVSCWDSCGFMPAVASAARRALAHARAPPPAPPAPPPPPLVPIGQLRGEPVEDRLAQADVVEQLAGPFARLPLLAADPRRLQDRAEQPCPHARVVPDHYVLG